MVTNKNPHIGEFLKEKLAISEEELKKFLNMQEYINEKIGEIAIRQKLINKKELSEIFGFQKKHLVSFGNAAIYLGFLKSSQVKYLLDLQVQDRCRIGELLVEEGVISQKDLLTVVKEFYSKKQTQLTILGLAGDSLCKEIRLAIEPYSYQFHACKDEEEMLLLIEKFNPQLIFLDHKKKKVKEKALKIKSATFLKSLKIVLLTKIQKKTAVLSGYEYGIDYILPVPLNAKHLLNILIDIEIHYRGKQKERVLVVDDSSIVRNSVAEDLTESGFKVIFAENGKEAVKIAPLEKPNLILMDINMPVMNGYEACLELAKNPITSKIPIIILTMNNTREEREKGFEVGAIEYFTKPFNKGHLSSYIKHMMFGNKVVRPEWILIAEDSLLHKHILESILNKYGYQFEIVKNGQEVFKVLEKGLEPSAILLDCYMPKMDGFQVCLKLKETEKYRHIPVIMITISKKKEDILNGLKCGADDFITKPFEEDELVARLEGHIRNFALFKNLQEKYKLLWESSERYRSAFEKAALGVALVMPDGHWLLSNHFLGQILGYSGEELLNISFQNIAHPDDLGQYMGFINQALKGSISHFQIDTRCIHKQGHTIWIQLNVSLVRGSGNIPLYFISQIQNITERKRAEEKLNELNQSLEKYANEMEELAEERSKQLIHADRLASLGTMAAGVAHEINNPTGFITNNLQIFERLWDRKIKNCVNKAISENGDKDLSFAVDEMPKMLKGMKEGTRRITKIVRSLSDFAKKIELVLEPLDIREVIESAAKFCEFETALKNTAKIQLDLPNNLPKIMLSRQEIEQVIINLITNAFHAMEEVTDGRKFILKISARHVSDHVVIEVTDNGCGMDDKVLNSIFDPFYSTKDPGKGTGLGLSVSHGIIEHHRGTIKVKSTLKKGSTFTINLPVDPSKEKR